MRTSIPPHGNLPILWAWDRPHGHETADANLSCGHRSHKTRERLEVTWSPGKRGSPKKSSPKKPGGGGGSPSRALPPRKLERKSPPKKEKVSVAKFFGFAKGEPEAADGAESCPLALALLRT